MRNIHTGMRDSNNHPRLLSHWLTVKAFFNLFFNTEQYTIGSNMGGDNTYSQLFIQFSTTLFVTKNYEAAPIWQPKVKVPS